MLDMSIFLGVVDFFPHPQEMFDFFHGYKRG